MLADIGMKSISVSRKKEQKRGRGRPATGIGRAEGLRLYPELSDAIEAWRGDQTEEVGRPEAIRRLLRSHPDLKRYLEGK